ncbi:MAG: hypothetical protein AMJ79_09245 [Phycisphaerae bacterium SM23_30]|nr:MAG: hypothetical protein AMJ79_09245 [Phycisphaerae bacterium SM23_30]
MDDCCDKIRFSLSDKTGEFRFTDFDITDAPECTGQVKELRALLLGRRLADINAAEILRISCSGNGQCMRSVVSVIKEYQERFLHNRSRNNHNISSARGA